MSASDYLIQVSVYFKGDLLEPNAWTAWLGATPTESHRKGHRWITVSGAEVVEKTGLWALTVKSSSGELSYALGELRKKISRPMISPEPESSVEEAYIDIFVAVDAEAGGGGTSEFEMTAKCVNLLAGFGLPVRYTISIVPE